MNGWKKYACAWMLCLLACCLTACAPARIKSNAALCTLRFQTDDPALEALSLENLRALAAFEAACGRLRIP